MPGTKPKAEPATISVKVIEADFELVSYRWFDGSWHGAVFEKTGGYEIRVMMTRSITNFGRDKAETYDYFELDADGVITKSPRGYARGYNKLRVRDIADAVTKYAVEDPAVPAMRV
jgi:hypothetical protein